MRPDDNCIASNVAIGTERRKAMSASLIGHQVSSAFRLPTTSGVNVARGLVLLFRIGTKALPSWDSKTRWNNLECDFAVKLTVGPSGHANSPHPSSREGHHSTAGWSSSFLLRVILHGFHPAATVACSRVHRNSVPSTQMRCRIKELSMPPASRAEVCW